MKLKCALLLKAVVALTITGSAYAVDEIKNRIFVIDSFEGLNTKITDISLPKKYSSLLENVRFDNEDGSLPKRNPIKLDADCGGSEMVNGLHRLYLINDTKVTLCNHGDEIKKKESDEVSYSKILDVATSDRRWQWITWHNIAIGTDGFNQPVKYDGTSDSATYLGSLLATDNGAGAGPDGTYTYKVECYTSSYDFTFNQPSNPVTVVDNDIDLTMIPVCPSSYLGESITGRKIYRIEDGGSTYKLLSNGTIADNSTVTLTDSDADGALGATLSTVDVEKPPLGKFLLVNNNRLWIANDPVNYPSRAHYSEDGLHDVFISDNYFNIRPNDGDSITGIFNILGRLTVFKNNTIQKIYTDGGDPDLDWAISDPFSFLGNQAPYSAVNTTAGIVYLGKNGIYVFNGQNSVLISDAVTPTIRDISTSNYGNVWGEYFKNSYFMAYTSKNSGSSINDRILVYDFVTNRFSIDTIGVNVLSSFDSGTDVEVLYSGSSANGNVFAHTDTVTEIVHASHSDFTGTWDDMRYIPTGLAGGVADDPVLEIAWTETLDDVGTSIDSTAGIIDRPDTDGQYISQVLQVNASTFDKIFWNESIPVSGGDVEFYIRTGNTVVATESASWNGPYSLSSGSDISGVSAGIYMQYRIDLTTDVITSTPILFKRDSFVVKITFSTSTSNAENSISFKDDTGWLDFGAPGLMKELKTFFVYYDWPENVDGELEVTFENFRGETDVFTIDLSENPKWYKEQFTDGTFSGESIQMRIREDSLNQIKIDRIIVVFDIAPPQFYPID